MPRQLFSHFGVSGLLTIVAVVATLLTLGPAAAVTTLVLIAIEIAFSFDNAIINAKTLERLSPAWQRLFLTIGMVIAILGMRLVFPIVIVMVTAHLSWSQVVGDAVHHPNIYGRHLQAAHASIAAFGGSFLLVLAFYFLFNDERDVLWLKQIERPLQRIGGSTWLPPAVVVAIVLAVSFYATHGGQILRAGLSGVVGYTAIKLFIDSLGRLSPRGQKIYTGWAAFLAFMYLQLLDASFSFDGVLGAFAITDKVILIALGLGVGALWVRSLTVFMVRRGTLHDYRYLEHGAHYAILVLAVALLGSIFVTVPDGVTGVAGLGVIGASFVASRQALRAQQRDRG
jgi:uncharacterized protein